MSASGLKKGELRMDESVKQLFREQIIRNFSEELHMDLLEEISDKELNNNILCSIQRVLTKAYEKGWKDGLDKVADKLREDQCLDKRKED